MARLLKNTSKDYKCVNCGNNQVSIIREGLDPRLKCLACNFMFDASQSEQAEKAGSIPKEALVDPNDFPEPETHVAESKIEDLDNHPISESFKIPRSPNYVFLSKDRLVVQFCTKKELVKTALKWSSRGNNFDLFELSPRKADVKVEIGE